MVPRIYHKVLFGLSFDEGWVCGCGLFMPIVIVNFLWDRGKIIRSSLKNISTLV